MFSGIRSILNGLMSDPGGTILTLTSMNTPMAMWR